MIVFWVLTTSRKLSLFRRFGPSKYRNFLPVNIGNKQKILTFRNTTLRTSNLPLYSNKMDSNRLSFPHCCYFFSPTFKHCSQIFTIYFAVPSISMLHMSCHRIPPVPHPMRHFVTCRKQSMREEISLRPLLLGD